MFSNAVLADLIDSKEELRKELQSYISDYISDYFSGGKTSINELTIDSGKLNSFEVVDVISFEEKESEEDIFVIGLLSVYIVADCFHYANNESILLGGFPLKAQVKFSFGVIPDKNKNPYGSEFINIEFSDIELE